MSDYTPEPAMRVFARELQETTQELDLGGGDMSANYFLLPSGEKVNRMFVVGTIISDECITHREEYSMYNAYLSDTTEDRSRVYFTAGEYAPDTVTSTLRQLDEDGNYPYRVALKGKVDTYEKDDGEVLVSLRPETLINLSAEDNGRQLQRQWLYETLDQTIGRFDAEEGDRVENGVDLVEAAKTHYPEVREELREDLLEIAERQADA